MGRIHAPTLLRCTLAAALALACTLAQSAQLIREVFRSQRLGRDVAYTLYLPDLPPGMREPALTIYLLHGAGGDEKTWTGEDPMLRGPLVQAMLDGTLRPSALVMPTVGHNSWWINGAVDPAASAFLEEVMPRVEARLPSAPTRERRALLGVSMGAFGALQFALSQPQRFCAASLIAPAVYDPLPPPDSSARRTAQFARGGQFDEALWQTSNYPGKLAAYARSPQKLPFWIIVGDRDHLGLLRDSTRLYERLREIQPNDVELRVIGGGHDWSTFDAALPSSLRFIDRHCR